MPRGVKNTQPSKAHCEQCGLLLAAGRLSVLAPQLVGVMMELGEHSPDPDAETPRERIDRVLAQRTQQVFVAKARVAALVDSIRHATCAGHERAKPGPRKKEPASVDPSMPPGIEPPPRRKRAKLQAVEP